MTTAVEPGESEDTPSAPPSDEVERRDGPISEHLLSGLERTPQAAAERVLAFLDWKGEGFGSVGPSLNYGDLRILAIATLQETKP